MPAYVADIYGEIRRFPGWRRREFDRVSGARHPRRLGDDLEGRSVLERGAVATLAAKPFFGRLALLVR